MPRVVSEQPCCLVRERRRLLVLFERRRPDRLLGPKDAEVGLVCSEQEEPVGACQVPPRLREAPVEVQHLRGAQVRERQVVGVLARFQQADGPADVAKPS